MEFLYIISIFYLYFLIMRKINNKLKNTKRKDAVTRFIKILSMSMTIKRNRWVLVEVM